MSQMILNRKALATVRDRTEPLEVCDERGNVLGVLQPAGITWHVPCEDSADDQEPEMDLGRTVGIYGYANDLI